jgi:hypothetical protein
MVLAAQQVTEKENAGKTFRAERRETLGAIEKRA